MPREHTLHRPHDHSSVLAAELSVQSAAIVGHDRALEHRGQCRAVIEGVQPQIDARRFPIKQTVGETVVVEADIFTDGHDALS